MNTLLLGFLQPMIRLEVLFLTCQTFQLIRQAFPAPAHPADWFAGVADQDRILVGYPSQPDHDKSSANDKASFNSFITLPGRTPIFRSKRTYGNEPKP